MRPGRVVEPAQLLRDLPYGGAFHSRAIGEHADGQPAVVERRNTSQPPSVLITDEFDPLERDIAAMQKITNHVADRGTHSSVDPYFRNLSGLSFFHVVPSSRMSYANLVRCNCIARLSFG